MVGTRGVEGNATAVTVTPYQIAVPDAALEDLEARLSRTRWPDAECPRQARTRCEQPTGSSGVGLPPAEVGHCRRNQTDRGRKHSHSEDTSIHECVSLFLRTIEDSDRSNAKSHRSGEARKARRDRLY